MHAFKNFQMDHAMQNSDFGGWEACQDAASKAGDLTELAEGVQSAAKALFFRSVTHLGHGSTSSLTICKAFKSYSDKACTGLAVCEHAGGATANIEFY